MNFRCFPQEFETGPYIEATEPECPFCHGTSTEFLRFDETKMDGKDHETHFCYDCEIEFDVATEIPY